MNELEATIAIKNGDENAFRHLFNLYYDRLVAYIVTYTHDKMTSEDIVQQAFINFWYAKDKLKDFKSPKSYLYTIAYNEFINTINKEKRQNNILNIVYENALRDRIEEDHEALERRVNKMNQIIQTLPPKCRQTLEMNKIKGMKYQEIAETTGVSVKTVESQMSLAFKKIRKGFEKENLHLLFMNFHKKIKLELLN
ncbi:RNA polymerase sigma factor [Flavivirga jejuensis]|uniref:RNA polymerase sigma-70 factor n=1 Tax=Flavivirga jejuensis TaxID=870487 RepID=A0ABT8WLB6_9FLAO|nr:RNA polymerase sigma-70 factor [Flavivirga jejuensis]MDO5973779.1 RNA polymerase sigma-70 factor [Flavivirga jejuensis]